MRNKHGMVRHGKTSPQRHGSIGPACRLDNVINDVAQVQASKFTVGY